MCSCERTSSSALIPRICGIVILGISLGMLCLTPSTALSATKRVKLRNEAKEMFYHAYKSYMDKAYPADELMPLSCRGRYRGSETSRGDIDDAMGNFSLTLVDTLDTLMVVGDIDEFERACQLVIRDVSFDIDAAVSVFETNIRMIGGLLSGHVMAELVQVKFQRMNWYRGELLAMAKDLGYRLLPAFNTTTGLPHSRINLRRGMVNELSSAPDTCTACAGTMLLEFAALSRLAGEPAFESMLVCLLNKVSEDWKALSEIPIFWLAGLIPYSLYLVRGKRSECYEACRILILLTSVCILLIGMLYQEWRLTAAIACLIFAVEVVGSAEQCQSSHQWLWLCLSLTNVLLALGYSSVCGVNDINPPCPSGTSVF
ncbi:unnamed protein product [Cyprideis torosa]|uniref:alpha-1,2-Mannosidase n=1 Tax=Cyprideis torosa TaxID=163714 RepID=A0A7R8ZR41_9CRUS|nr:unnamed protein product [Cyprideis torosa]CAG0897965.1 unnamed protein product [Cyprideis torosa]